MQGVCFICCDDKHPAPRASCACRSSFVHRACQLRWMEASGRDTCEVCLCRYGNLRLVHQLRVTMVGLAVLTQTTTAFLGGCISTHYLILGSYDAFRMHLVVAYVACTAVLALLSTCAAIKYGEPLFLRVPRVQVQA